MGKSLIGIVFVAALALASSVLVSVQPADQTIAGPADQTIVGQAASMPELSTFVTAVKAAGLVTALSAPGPFTVFAPSNDAFAALPADKLAFLLKPENKAQLVDLLTYHVVADKTLIVPADITDPTSFKTLEGRDVQTDNIRGNIFIQRAQVTQSNVIASNGIIQIIDAVLNPGYAPGGETIVQRALVTPELSTFVTALKAAGLVNTLSTKGPFTVFAPSNKAFAALPEGVLADLLRPENIAQLVKLLTYHVVAGEYGTGPYYAKDKMFENDPYVESLEGAYISTGIIDGKLYIDTAEARIAPHLGCSNGVVYTIDQVLNPAVYAPRTVVAFAAATPKLSTLVTALNAAGLVDTLEGKGQFTVFAPSNKAFAALPEGVLADLLKPENKAQLVDLLTYHVVKGPRDLQAAYFEDGQMIKTVEGKSVTVRTVASDSAPSYLGKNIFIDSAEVMFADNGAENGVVHIIDAVLMPGTAPPAPTPTPTPTGKTVVDIAAATPELSTLVTALKAAGLVDTLSEEQDFTVFAPTNKAFEALPAGTLANLLKPENRNQLVDLLLYHVVEDGFAYFAKDLVKFNTIHTLDTCYAQNPEGCPDGKYVQTRQISGELFINTAKVITADVAASNGVVHVIDTVLNPAAWFPKTVVELAAATPELSTFVTAVKAAGLVEFLSYPGNNHAGFIPSFTVFAPSNKAFAALPAGTLANLLKPENKAQLADLLLYHVVEAQYYAHSFLTTAGTPLEDKQKIKTSVLEQNRGQGKTVTVRTVQSPDVPALRKAIFINSAEITFADNGASNGVVHIIDAVLMPGSAQARRLRA